MGFTGRLRKFQQEYVPDGRAQILATYSDFEFWKSLSGNTKKFEERMAQLGYSAGESVPVTSERYKVVDLAGECVRVWTDELQPGSCS